MKFSGTNKFLIVIKLIFVCLILLTNCNYQSESSIKSRALDTATKYYNINNHNGWGIKKSFMKDEISFPVMDDEYSGGRCYYQKIDKDTIFRLAFEYYESNNDTMFVPLDYYQRYEEDAFYQHIILFGEKSDTLFHYKAPMFEEMIKIFIRGEYYYKYLFNILNKQERLYFIENKDSLTAIKGNNLPPLLTNRVSN